MLFLVTIKRRSSLKMLIKFKVRKDPEYDLDSTILKQIKEEK